MDLLYFPTIAIPDGSWLRRALLYSDRVRSIAPDGYVEQHRAREMDLLRFLRDEGQYEPLIPDFDSIPFDSSRDFHDEFKSSLVPYLREREPNFQEEKYITIHAQKFSISVLDLCMELGVVRRLDHEWYAFEGDVGNLYMSMLAKYMALNAMDEVISSTDSCKLANHVLASKAPTSEDMCLGYSLRSALPEPAKDVPLHDLITFKRRRSDELLRLRQETRRLERDLARASSRSEVKDITNAFEERLTVALSDVRSALRDARIESRASTVKGFISLRPDSPLAGGIGSGIISKLADFPPESVAPSIIAGAALVVACERVSAWTKQRGARRSAAFAYLYEAGREGMLARGRGDR